MRQPLSERAWSVKGQPWETTALIGGTRECQRLLRTASIPIGCNRGRLHLWEDRKQMRLEKSFNRW